MKKLFLILSVLTSSHCFSQSLLSLSRLSFGLKGGVNYSNYSHTDFATNALVGFHAGALVRYKLTDNFSSRLNSSSPPREQRSAISRVRKGKM